MREGKIDDLAHPERVLSAMPPPEDDVAARGRGKPPEPAGNGRGGAGTKPRRVVDAGARAAPPPDVRSHHHPRRGAVRAETCASSSAATSTWSVRCAASAPPVRCPSSPPVPGGRALLQRHVRVRFQAGLRGAGDRAAVPGHDRARSAASTCGPTTPDNAGAVAEAIARALGDGYEVRSWEELNRGLFMALKLEKIAMFIVLTFIALVASFSIVSNLIMMVTEKGREVAILKAMGASDGAILRVFFAEGLYIGLLGLSVGVTLGIAGCRLDRAIRPAACRPTSITSASCRWSCGRARSSRWPAWHCCFAAWPRCTRPSWPRACDRSRGCATNEATRPERPALTGRVDFRSLGRYVAKPHATACRIPRAARPGGVRNRRRSSRRSSGSPRCSSTGAAPSACSKASTWSCAPARWWPWWARRASASRRCCTCWAPSTRPPSGRSCSTASTSPRFSPAQLADFRNRQIGFVFQFHHLLPEFTALENAMMPGLILRMPRRSACQAGRSPPVRVGLADRLTHRPGELSGGEQQRVALARALLLRRACCWRTSRPATSTPRPAARCTSCSSSSTASWA